MIMHYYQAIKFLGWAHRPDCNAWVVKCFDYFVLDYAESGTLLMQIDEQPVQRLRGPVAFLTFPGPCFRFGRRRPGFWNHRFISFRGPQAELFLKSGLFPIQTPVLPLGDPQRFGRDFDRLLEYMDGQTYGTPRAAHMLAGLLLQLHERPAATQSMLTDRRIFPALTRISAQPERAWDLCQLASDSHLSYVHFRRLFLQATGLPPGGYIVVQRLEKAGKLLRQSAPLALKEIAALCGYADIYYFNKAFRKYYGVPPGRYRSNFNFS